MAFGRIRSPLNQAMSWRSTLILLLSACSCIASAVEHVFSPEYAGTDHVAISDNADVFAQTYDALGELKDALEKMQSEYFEVWLGVWPATIDWTGAVMGTYVSAALNSLSRTSSYRVEIDEMKTPSERTEGQVLENYISRYFSQISAYYFGENAFALRTQAYDDMLWVVLGWLESVKFMNKHEELHYKSPPSLFGSEGAMWHGKQFEPAFAHRSHVFYDIVERGWDDLLCGGGLTWNPRLEPYKNTITNTLFIAASIGMYLYHPGDSNSSPFLSQAFEGTDGGIPYARRHDRRYLRFAIQAYDWLKGVNLTNSQGLYVDGYHIRNYGLNGSRGTGKCDARNEMVYTYNQGVVLSGLRGLWESTGNLTYLEDGHRLVRNVIAATGWSIPDQAEHSNEQHQSSSASWGGIGRDGILQEFCDASATCSQDGQTFKGIFFNHLTQFCEPLPTDRPLIPGRTYLASPDEANLHSRSCKDYTPWVARNAKAAVSTKNEKGLFGMWWGADSSAASVELPQGAVDVRNQAWIVEEDPVWQGPRAPQTHEKIKPRLIHPTTGQLLCHSEVGNDSRVNQEERDYNDRGRGRTVETQGGGLMVVRALWEFITLYGA